MRVSSYIVNKKVCMVVAESVKKEGCVAEEDYMEKIIIKPHRLKGEVVIPPSKSLAHRSIISASLSRGCCRVGNVQYSEDIEATIEVMEKLGARITKHEDSVEIDGTDMFSLNKEEIEFDCNESGSTLRFLIPIALTHEGSYRFTGRGKLGTRPLISYYDIFDRQKIYYRTDNGALPLEVDGKLKSGTYEVRGDISSQFISGLLFALPLLEGDSEIVITTNMESKGYVDLTVDVLKSFGIEIENNDYRSFKIKGGQKYSCTDYRVEGDYSQAAFFLVSGAIGSDVCVEGLRKDSLQGDRVIVDIMKEMGCSFEEGEGYIKALPSKTKGIDIDVSECPDLVPILAVLACMSEGTTRILNAGRLRIKECDRLHAVTEELNKLGADITELQDSLIIKGIDSFTGGEADSHNDHRIAMAVSIAATRCKGEVVLSGFTSVRKSYPGFFKDYVMLGGKLSEFDNGKQY